MGFTTDPQQVNKILLKKPQLIVGGVDVLLVGKPGSGKTTALAQCAIINYEKHKEVIIWRSSPDCQWSYFLNLEEPPKLILWLRKGVEYKMFDRDKEKYVDPLKYFSEIKTWETEKELVENLSRDYINVVQTSPFSATKKDMHIKFCREWMKIYEELNIRLWKQKVSVFFDELEDLVPEAKGGGFFDVELSLSSLIRSLRKNDISSYLAGHSVSEIHWRINKKIRFFGYMQGADTKKNSRLKKNLNNLKTGECWIEGDQIECFTFKNLGREKQLRAIISCHED